MPDNPQQDAAYGHARFDPEERLAFLERHVQQQDREIYAQSEQIRRLQAALLQLRGQFEASKAAEGQAGADSERPPHY